MKILLTAFDPFGGEFVNPALEAVKRVAPPEGVTLVRLEVPTVFGLSVETVIRAMQQEKPDAVLMVGQAGGRNAVTPERIAINLMDARMADNAGNMPVDEPIVFDGENALFSTLPVKKLAVAIEKTGIAARVSNTAGTFVCNQLMYGVLHWCKTRQPTARAGFVHVPYIPEQIRDRPGIPSLPLKEIISALEAALGCIVESAHDSR